jgi:hypothetical protein
MKSPTKNNFLKKILKTKVRMGRFAQHIEFTEQKEIKVHFAKSFEDYRKYIMPQKNIIAGKGINEETFNAFLSDKTILNIFGDILIQCRTYFKKDVTFELVATNPNTGKEFKVSGMWAECLGKVQLIANELNIKL